MSDNPNARLTITTDQQGKGFYVAQFKTAELAIFSYYIESNKEAILIDPVYDGKVYRDMLGKRHANLKYIFLTHYHADYLSGHTEFKVPIVMGPDSTRAVNKFKVKECHDGELLPLGSIKMQIMHTPGHTLESTSYILRDATGKEICIFSGDCVFLGEIGRPDLAVAGKISKEDLAGMLYESVQRYKKLNPDLRLYPGHGSGSACGKAIGGGNFCTVGGQFGKNYGFLFTKKQDFVKALVNIPQPPKYFFFDATLNQSGATFYNSNYNHANVGLSQKDFEKYRQIMKVVDTRLDVGKGIIRGTIWLPSNGAFVNWISNFFGPEEQFLLIVDKNNESDVIERLLRIGYFKIKGFNNFDVGLLNADFVKPNILKFDTLNQVKNATHVDVRNTFQHESSGIIEGAIPLPLRDIESNLDKVKGKNDLVINCLGGIRARVAFSILAKYNIPCSVLAEEFKDFKNKGLKIVDFAQ